MGGARGRVSGCGWRRESRQRKGCKGGGGGDRGAEGPVKWGRKGSENFRVNMVWLVYPYTATSPPLDLIYKVLYAPT